MGDVLQTKNGGGPTHSTWNTVIAIGKLHQWLILIFDKNMNFFILVVCDLTNDISYLVNLNISKNCYFWGKIVKSVWKNREKFGNICSIHICWYIGITFCTVVVVAYKDISYDSKLNESKNSSFWDIIFEFRA